MSPMQHVTGVNRRVAMVAVLARLHGVLLTPAYHHRLDDMRTDRTIYLHRDLGNGMRLSRLYHFLLHKLLMWVDAGFVPSDASEARYSHFLTIFSADRENCPHRSRTGSFEWCQPLAPPGMPVGPPLEQQRRNLRLSAIH